MLARNFTDAYLTYFKASLEQLPEKEFLVLLSHVVTNPANIDGSPIARNKTKALSQNDIVSCITCDINQLEPLTWHYTSQVNDRLTTQNFHILRYSTSCILFVPFRNSGSLCHVLPRTALAGTCAAAFDILRVIHESFLTHINCERQTEGIFIVCNRFLEHIVLYHSLCTFLSPWHCR